MAPGDSGPAGRGRVQPKWVSSESARADVAVLEIGGTHVTAARVDATVREVRAGTVRRYPLSSGADAGRVIGELLAAANGLGATAGAKWGVATPGPFDYRRGIALFRGVGKFDSLYGRDIRAALMTGIDATPGHVTFLGDAEAFAVGECQAGAGMGVGRCVGLTVGTGIGSAFLAGGRIVDDGPTVPPKGEVHRLTVEGQPLEDLVSRRAIVRSYRAATQRTAGDPNDHDSAATQRADGDPDGHENDADLDVHEIAAAARAGDTIAGTVLDAAFRTLGSALAPWVRASEAELVVVGGSIAGSWDLLAGPLEEGLAAGGAPGVAVRAGRHLDTSPLIGAAWAAGSDPRAPGSGNDR
jgi:glucokinase